MTETTESVQEFRDRAALWAKENLEPASAQDGIMESDDDQQARIVSESRVLQRKIFDAGFAGIRYPKEYGGLGLTREYQLAWREATAGYRLPQLFNVTHGILGPTLLEFGTEEQKRKHLPAMLNGDELWVQFLSEPSGGSDLAGLLTRATPDGDTFLLNGSKIWSTGAHFSNYAMVLARTNSDVPKHRGLSMFMLPIRSEGVTVNPIKLVTGGSHFCQEFFDDVVLTRDSLIGEENDGWRIATGLLFHERNMIGANSLNDHAAADGEADPDDDVIALARAVGRTDDPNVRQLIGQALVLQHIAGPTIARINALIKSGEMPPTAASLVKLMGAVQQFDIKEIGLKIGGVRAVMAGKTDVAGSQAQRWLGARTGRIAGGSDEMQRNGISERVLGLPREPTPDRDIPFSEVLARRRQQ